MFVNSSPDAQKIRLKMKNNKVLKNNIWIRYSYKFTLWKRKKKINRKYCTYFPVIFWAVWSVRDGCLSATTSQLNTYFEAFVVKPSDMQDTWCVEKLFLLWTILFLQILISDVRHDVIFCTMNLIFLPSLHSHYIKL